MRDREQKTFWIRMRERKEEERKRAIHSLLIPSVYSEWFVIVRGV